MRSIIEIEKAIEMLPDPLVDELAGWLDALRARRAASAQIYHWLQQARGAAGKTTAGVIAETRGED